MKAMKAKVMTAKARNATKASDQLPGMKAMTVSDQLSAMKKVKVSDQPLVKNDECFRRFTRDVGNNDGFDACINGEYSFRLGPKALRAIAAGRSEIIISQTSMGGGCGWWKFRHVGGCAWRCTAKSGRFKNALLVAHPKA